MDHDRFTMLMANAQQEITTRFSVYEQLAKLAMPKPKQQ